MTIDRTEGDDSAPSKHHTQGTLSPMPQRPSPPDIINTKCDLPAPCSSHLASPATHTNGTASTRKHENTATKTRLQDYQVTPTYCAIMEYDNHKHACSDHKLPAVCCTLETIWWCEGTSSLVCMQSFTVGKSAT